MLGYMMQQKHWVLLGLLLLGLGGGYYWMIQTDDSEEVAEQSEEDISREQTEAHMRQIGYVQ